MKNLRNIFYIQKKQNFTNKQMTNLITDDNVIITDPDKVADRQRNFYEKLYSKDRNLPEREHIRDKLDNLNIPSLPDNISESLEGKLYMKELTVSLKNTKNNKSPGIDGYPIEFYKFFWKDLGNFVLNALNFFKCHWKFINIIKTGCYYMYSKTK